ncbi:DUF4097 family beta strand repeat protein [Streptomyces sp. NA02950]|uniref:DUF4097 family beta strand repeat-containing protein n=1 Tax=Streptomyces sp. NA02950 TaxID=2742137 RepID=UPI00158FC55F|nr:DUF4097 family beta strand repeat-containing protein [Streptomyces sp. NA02950]QKV93891.1 DUF4097 family beta strand repeat protein [Streptomyces sp. NA02950]
MVEHAFNADSAGSVVLNLTLPLGRATVTVDRELERARVILRTEDTTGPGADAVRRATIQHSGRQMSVQVPEIPGAVMMSSGGPRVTQTVGTIGFGNVVTGLTFVNGQLVTAGTSMPTIRPIEAIVMLPAQSSLSVVTTAADTTVRGKLARLTVHSVSGDVTAMTAHVLEAHTTSGDIEAETVTGELLARSVSGDVRVLSYRGDTANATTTSGDIRLTATPEATGFITASSVSGDVQVTGARHLNPRARSVSGDVLTR